MKYSLSVAALAAAVSFATAQHEAAAYGQCGGRNHHAKACVPGFHCHVFNDWYSQCIPGNATSSAASTSSTCMTKITVSKAFKTSSAVSLATSVGAVSGSASEPAIYGSVTLTYSASSAGSSAVVIAPTATASPVKSSSVATVSTSPKPTSTSVKAATSSAEVYSSSEVAAISTSAIATTAAASSSAPASSTKVVSSTAAASSASAATTGSYPTTSGTDFVIDGETGYFSGTNSYWIGFLTDNDDVDLVMQHLKASGLKILRVWGFNDVTSTPSTGTLYYQSFAGSEPTINTGADGLQRLDYVVKSAEAHGIKLIINFVNNWTDYGGMAAYFTYAGITDNT